MAPDTAIAASPQTSPLAPASRAYAPAAAVRLEAVTKVYGAGRGTLAALDSLTLDIDKGSFTCIVGASGCGKTTLLNLIAGLDEPTSGTIEVTGSSALMFQESALFPWLTAAGNVELALRLRGVGESARRQRALELLDVVHLGGFAAKRPHELSGGMRQRVALARALAQDADVLLMDEPFGALDAITRDLLHEELESVWSQTGLTVVFVTHNVREAARLGDRIVLLASRPGRLAASFDVDLPRPRRIEDSGVTTLATRVTEQLRQEVAAMATVLEPGLTGEAKLASELAGLDALEQPNRPAVSLLVRIWRATWPKVAAIGLALFAWQVVVWSGWRPTYVLPGPMTVLAVFWSDLGQPETWKAIATTLRRAAVGFSLAVVVGTLIGLAVSRFKSLRTAVGSLITGLQTMPSIAWFPLALLLFRLSEAAIMFVVVIGAAPSIANGLISGIDHVPPLWTRAGRVLGARGLNEYRFVILPAALPSFLGGLKQGWAFAWRSLMAGELLVIIANQPSIGSRLEFEREFADSAGLMSVMLLILVLGVAVDAIAFSTLQNTVRRRRGLGES